MLFNKNKIVCYNIKKDRDIKMKEKILVTDVDFVLLDWVYGLKPFLESKGISSEHLESYKGSTYYPCLSELFFNDCEETNLKLLHEFNDSEYIKHLPIFEEGSHEHLGEISENIKVFALTCLGTGEEQKQSRWQNLRDHYGDIFEDTICIPVRTSKEPYLRELMEKYEIIGYVDDREKHLQEAINCNITPLLYKRNEKYPDTDIKVVNGWSEIKEYVDNSLKNKVKKRFKI